MIFVRVVAFVLGLVVVLATALSAVRTFVLPRGEVSRLSRAVFLASRAAFSLRSHWADTYEKRDRVWAMYAPLSLLALPAVWLMLVLVGYTAMFWAVEGHSPRAALTAAGSGLLTLGFAAPRALPQVVLTFTEAVLGLGLLALLLSYLPAMYSNFSRREAAVALLEVRAGSPPSAGAMIERFHRIEALDALDNMWVTWEQWFVEIEESHTSLAALPFFRSPQPDRSWVTAAGAVLDTASLTASTLDLGRRPQAEICIRSGYIALRRIADYFSIPYDPDPRPDDPISIAREEWEAVYEQLKSIGVPVRADRDSAWRAFAGWRVNYDTVLLSLANLTMAPYAPWSSDRQLRVARTPITRRAQRARRAASVNPR